MGQQYEDEDPLTRAIAPPPNETPQERRAREAAEAEARRISDMIDDEIRQEREAEKRKKKAVKLLLLGQSESGKTATLKNFQLQYSRRQWLEDRDAWRSVIHLNLVRNVNSILDMLAKEIAATTRPDSPSDDSDPPRRRHSRQPSRPSIPFTDTHRVLRTRLAPLKRVQKDLERRLGDQSKEMYTTDVHTAAPFDDMAAAGSPAPRGVLQEFSINSTNGWKSALDRFRRGGVPDARADAAMKLQKQVDAQILDTIASCRDDMRALWNDPAVRAMLDRRRSRIEDGPGFFLNDSDRIAARGYDPTDADIVRARLRTVGVQEHKFMFEVGRTAGQEWRFFDVGGTRSSRAAWYPYFDDVDAIIFLAPISCFDEKLAEDRRVNRLEDSYLLWRSVVSCKLLARTQIILFLNKCDLLQTKLNRGVKIRDSVPSFGERPNNLATATKYFQQHFKEILRQHSPVQRPFYVYLTSVIDTKATAATLGAVEESILRNHLRRADLI
ncbi:G-alpha-domain-containing protein [Schizophyllum commune Tattone D]|nr:G-alpha-domain-containing protein [Schizophyllum commune Tattone D]